MVLSDDPGSSARITAFTTATSRWLVAVRMVSEGVDVPRLAVGVYATSASTPLFFAQAIGRFVRSRRPGETASIFLPSVPNLLQLASELEQQRNHVLGKPHRESEGDPLDAELAEQRRDEPANWTTASSRSAPRPNWTRSSSTARRSAPRHPQAATRRPTTSASPGCSTPTQMRDLLRRRQDEQLQKRTASGESPPPSAHGQLRELRRELNALVSIAHHRTGKPHGWIHNELRRICGGPPIAAATTVQLQARIKAVHSLTASSEGFRRVNARQRRVPRRNPCPDYFARFAINAQQTSAEPHDMICPYSRRSPPPAPSPSPDRSSICGSDALRTDNHSGGDAASRGPAPARRLHLDGPRGGDRRCATRSDRRRRRTRRNP